MAYKYPPEVEQFLNDLENWDHGDVDTDRLLAAMEWYCSMWDQRQGFIHALKLTIEDQWMNHGPEQDIRDISKLRRRLNISPEPVKIDSMVDSALKDLLDAHGVSNYDITAIREAAKEMDKWANVYSCGCM